MTSLQEFRCEVCGLVTEREEANFLHATCFGGAHTESNHRLIYTSA